MAIVRPLGLVPQSLIQQCLSRVHADDEQRRFHAVVGGGVSDIRHIRAALALDRPYLSLPPFRREAVYLICVVAAGVDAGAHDVQHRPVFLLEAPQQEIVEVLPYLLFQHIAVYLLVADAPALLANAPADHLYLKAVVLHVHTGCQHQHSLRHVCVVQLPPVQQCGILHLLALLLPRFAQLRVHPDFHALRVSLIELFLCHKEFLHDLFP